MRLLQSLTRGLKALDILREADAPLRLTHIAELLDVDKSNASHILKTLVAADMHHKIHHAAIQLFHRKHAPQISIL